MKILDVLVDSAQMLGLIEEVNLLKTITPETENDVVEQNQNVASLFNLVKFSIRELCSNYIPVIEETSVETVDKKFAVGTLENFIRIQNIYKQGEMVKFKIINRNVVLEEDSIYQVRYETYPTIVSVFDGIEFLQNFSPDAIVLGLCSYFSISHGLFDEFKNFHEQYVLKAESLKSLHNFRIPARSWQWNKNKLLK